MHEALHFLEDNSTLNASNYNATFTISNKHPQNSILYRVKTTNPKAYRVKPSHGRLLHSCLTAINIDLAGEGKRSDKFQVKWVVLSNEQDDQYDDNDFNDIFEKAGKSFGQQLKCILPEPLLSMEATPMALNLGQNEKLENAANSPQRLSSVVSDTSSIAEAVKTPVKEHSERKEIASKDQPSTINDLRTKLDEALAKNSRLQQEINSLKVWICSNIRHVDRA